MAINALLPVVGASKGITGQVIKATLVFGPAINRTGSPAKVKPVHLYRTPSRKSSWVSSTELRLLSTRSMRRLHSPPAMEQLRTGVCDSAQLHTHHGPDAILISSLVDPLHSVFSLYAPIGAGVYHFDSNGALKSRRTASRGSNSSGHSPRLPSDFSERWVDRPFPQRPSGCLSDDNRSSLHQAPHE